MRPTTLVFFVFLMLVIPSGFCEAAVPAGSTNVSQSSNYWIHLDPVSDKHVNDTFFITGTTNIPTGEVININTGLAGMPHRLKHDVSVYWYREYNVPVLDGHGGQNTFTTPPIQITPSGTNEVIRQNDEYIVIAKYNKSNIYIATTVTTFAILPHMTSSIPIVPPALEPMTVYFFYSKECSHCDNVMPFIQNLSRAYPEFTFTYLEIWHNDQNFALYQAINAYFGVKNHGVPEVVLGKTYLVGEKEISDKLESTLIEVSSSEVPSTAAPVEPTLSPSPSIREEPVATPPTRSPGAVGTVLGTLGVVGVYLGRKRE